MANRNKGRRGRSRKRRGSTAVAATAAGESAPAAAERPAAAASPKRASRARARAGDRERSSPRGFKDPQSYGERPEAPWHPLPLSELLILIGAITTVIGATKLKSGISSGSTTLIVGVVAVLIGTVEFTFREHRSGYRSHTILLAVLPAVVVYTGTLAILSAFVSPLPAGLKVAPLALALPVFGVLFRLLRASFQDARRERVLAGPRRR